MFESLVRYRDEQGETHYGGVKDGIVHRVASPLSFQAESLGEVGPEDQVALVAPVEPRNVVCAGMNLKKRFKLLGDEIPSSTGYFLKPASGIVSSGDPVDWPGWINDYVVFPSAEVAVVIGSVARNIKAENAADVILGYTGSNELEVVKEGMAWYFTEAFTSKGWDTATVLGQRIVPWDGSPIPFSCAVDGRTIQSSTTEDYVTGIPGMIEDITRVMTLYPGDIILCGASPAVDPETGNMLLVDQVSRKGMEVVIEVGAAGTLTNTVG